MFKSVCPALGGGGWGGSACHLLRNGGFAHYLVPWQSGRGACTSVETVGLRNAGRQMPLLVLRDTCSLWGTSGDPEPGSSGMTVSLQD